MKTFAAYLGIQLWMNGAVLAAIAVPALVLGARGATPLWIMAGAAAALVTFDVAWFVLWKRRQNAHAGVT